MAFLFFKNEVKEECCYKAVPTVAGSLFSHSRMLHYAIMQPATLMRQRLK